MELVLVHPEIPHNTGCAARLAAATGLRLHLVQPLGFSLEDRYLKRAGLDYWHAVDLVLHPSWEAASEALHDAALGPLEPRLRLFTARGGASLFDVPFGAGDVLVFGGESSGLPAELLAAHAAQRVTVPVRPVVRSLNLANTVCLATYTALHVAGVPMPPHDGTHTPQSGAASTRPADVVRRSASAGGER